MRFVFILSFLIFTLIGWSEAQEKFQVAYQWHALVYSEPPLGAPYNQSHPVPFGIARYKNRMFIGTARRNVGIPSTLSYINLSDRSQDPLLIPYPSYHMNTVDPRNTPDNNRIVSVYRPRVDNCDRLWFVDTGVLEIPNNRIVVQRPSVWVINLKTDTLVQRYEIPQSLNEQGRGIVSLTIDDPDGTCQNTFAYLTDWLVSRLIVYSLKQNRAWVVDHNYFSFDPLYGNFDVDGLKFSRRDGLFSIALSHVRKDGYKIAFFHAMVSDAEFIVSTEVLQNETLATRTYHGRDFRLLGHRGGHRSQAGIHVYDKKNRIMFTTLLQKNAVDCWRFDHAFGKNFIDTIDQNDELLYYPVDLIIDDDSTIWILSNKMPRVIYSRLDFSENNFYILRANVKDVIRGKKCNNRDGIDKDRDLYIFRDGA